MESGCGQGGLASVQAWQGLKRVGDTFSNIDHWIMANRTLLL
jgi:hypothetical protein